MDFLIGMILFLFLLFFFSIIVLFIKLFQKSPVTIALILIGISLFEDDCDIS